MNKRLLSSDNWQNYLAVATEYWSQYKAEKAVRTCLAYLHSHTIPPPFVDSNQSCNQPAIIIGAGGNGERWMNFMNRPKHMVDTGDGLPLIQRTINLLSCYFKECRIYVVIGREHEKLYSTVLGATLLYREGSSCSSLYLEIIDNQIKKHLGNRDVLWLHGDVFWSTNAIERIKNETASLGKLKVFGRKHRNASYLNNGGEDFGWYIPNHHLQILRDWYLFTREIYLSARMYRISTWEIVSLMTLAERRGLVDSKELKSQYRDPLQICNRIISIFSARDFSRNLWVEIDDSTEDFDFPIEYITRLFLKVKRVGLGTWDE